MIDTIRQHCPTANVRHRAGAWVAIATAICTTATATAQQATSNYDPLPGVDAGLEEIVVTANRRAESINKVPASIAAYSQEALDQQGIRNFADIAAQTPGLSLVLPSTFQPANIAIRGIRSVAGSATTGIYIDDTPIQTRSTGPQNAGDALPYIFDLDRIEVLRGPQGTLFGSGSEGGAVRFISPAPDLENASGYARSEVASTDDGDLSYEGGMAAGVPLIDGKLAARFSASYRHDGGYVDRINERTGAMVDENANSSNVHTMKAALLYAPLENVRIKPSVNFQETRIRDSAQYYTRLSDPSEQRLISGRTLRQPSEDRFYLPAVTMEADVGGVTATSVTSYFSRRQSGVLDFSNLDEGVARLFNTNRPGGPLPGVGVLPLPILLPEAFVAAGGSRNVIDNEQDNFTQEFRLQSNDATAALSWLVGGFYQRAKQANVISVNDAYYADEFEILLGFPNVNGITRYFRDYSATDQQVAGFVNVDYRIGEFKVSSGARIASTKFSFEEILNGSFTRGLQTNGGEQKESPVTPKVGVTWEPNDDALMYVSAAKGFRVGGANVPITPTGPCLASLTALGLSAAPTSYDSDSVWNYELGAKFSSFERKLQVNASVYHIDWSDIQSFVSLTGCPGGFVSNLGSATSEGFDLAISARPAESLFVSLSGGYNRSRFDETLVSSGVVLAQKDGIVSDAPPWQVTATIEYSLAIGGGDGYIRAIDQYASRNGGLYSKFDTPTASGFDAVGERNEAFHLASLRLGWRNDSFDLSLFIDNLLNADPQLNHVSNAFPTDTTYYANTLRPRTIGLTVTARR